VINLEIISSLFGPSRCTTTSSIMSIDSRASSMSRAEMSNDTGRAEVPLCSNINLPWSGIEPGTASSTTNARPDPSSNVVLATASSRLSPFDAKVTSHLLLNSSAADLVTCTMPSAEIDSSAALISSAVASNGRTPHNISLQSMNQGHQHFVPRVAPTFEVDVICNVL
jgi:hypothetical protein